MRRYIILELFLLVFLCASNVFAEGEKFLAHHISASGYSWQEPAFDIKRVVVPMITIEARNNVPFINPAISDGHHTITFKGELSLGMKLVITPERKAFIYPGNFLPCYIGLVDKNDPTGFKKWDDRYVVLLANPHIPIDPSTRYTLIIEGKVEGGAQSFVWMLFQPGEKGVELMCNRLSTKWSSASQEFQPPEGTQKIHKFGLYRYQQTGSIWYGLPKIIRADQEIKDVTGQLKGEMIELKPGEINILTYKDDAPSSYAVPRVSVQLSVDKGVK